MPDIWQKKGFVTISFDATHHGGSGGEPGELEDPMERIGDIFVVVDYLQTLPYVDGKRIGTGGGYVVATTALDHRIGAGIPIPTIRCWRAAQCIS